MNRSPVFSAIVLMNMKLEKAEEKLTKRKLLKIIQGLLRTDANLDFLLQLANDELEVLVATIRGRLDRSI